MHLLIKSPTLVAMLALAPLWLCAPLAHAALGGDAASITADAELLHGTVTTQSLPFYEMREITDTNGTRVREFMTRAGVVFAVLWNGPAVPDLKVLLGAHFAAYAVSLAAVPHPGLHRALRLASPDLVVEMDGHMRAYAGRAYLPALIPAGTSPTTLR